MLPIDYAFSNFQFQTNPNLTAGLQRTAGIMQQLNQLRALSQANQGRSPSQFQPPPLMQQSQALPAPQPAVPPLMQQQQALPAPQPAAPSLMQQAPLASIRQTMIDPTQASMAGTLQSGLANQQAQYVIPQTGFLGGYANKIAW